MLKWERIHPRPGKYDFDLADKYVAFGQEYHMFIVGHTLIWHNQVPAWVFHDDKGNLLSRDALLARMKDHIFTVVGRYKGKIQSWDVVNEALNEDGTLRQSLWFKIIGPDYIEKAFEYAHEADPQAQLIYNDYSLENEAKRNGAIALDQEAEGGRDPDCRRRASRATTTWTGPPPSRRTRQSRHSRRWESRSRSLNSISTCCPAPASQPHRRRHPEDPAECGAESVRRTDCRIPFSSSSPHATPICFAFSSSIATPSSGSRSGASPMRDSWLNDWPVKGRTSYPLLFDRSGQPKPAYDAVIRVASESKNH